MGQPHQRIRRAYPRPQVVSGARHQAPRGLVRQRRERRATLRVPVQRVVRLPAVQQVTYLRANLRSSLPKAGQAIGRLLWAFVSREKFFRCCAPSAGLLQRSELKRSGAASRRFAHNAMAGNWDRSPCPSALPARRRIPTGKAFCRPQTPLCTEPKRPQPDNHRD